MSVEEMEKKNIEMYSKYGTNRNDEYIYNCVLCKKKCSIDTSMSNQGHRLICNSCSRTRFKTLYAAMEWVYNKEEK